MLNADPAGMMEPRPGWPEQKELAAARGATRLMFLVAGIGMAAWAPMVPYVKARLGLDEGTLGLVLLALGAGSAVSMPLAGIVAHRWGYRHVLQWAGLLAAVALPLLTWAPGVTALTAALFGFGFLLGTMDVAMNTHAVEVERRDGRALMSGFHGLFSIGGLLGSGGLSVLLSLGMPLLAAAAAIGAILAVVVTTQGSRLLTAEEGTAEAEQVRLRLPDRLLLLLGLLCFASFLAEGALLDWSAVFLRDVRGVSPQFAGLGYAGFSVAMAGGRLAGDATIERLGAVLTVRVGAAVAAAGLLLSTQVASVGAALVGFVLVGLGAANVVPVMFSAAGRLPGRVPSMSLATVTALGYAGMLSGPAFIGFVAHASSLASGLALVAGLLLCVSAGAGIVRPRAEGAR